MLHTDSTIGGSDSFRKPSLEPAIVRTWRSSYVARESRKWL